MHPAKSIKIFIENNQTTHEYPLGTSLHEIALDQKIDTGNPILGAMVNHKLKELSYEIYKPKTIRFLDFTHTDGRRMYIRSLSFVLYLAAWDLFPNNKLQIMHSVSNGIFCQLDGLEHIADYEEIANKLDEKMREIVAHNLSFDREEIPTSEAIELFEKSDLHDKSELLKTRKQFYTSVYKLNGVVNYFYGYLVPSTGYLTTFKLINYEDGMLLLPPKEESPGELENVSKQDKLFEIFTEFKEWVNILGVPNIGRLNQMILDNKISDIIKIAEALQEKKLACIADMIHKRKDVKVALISGPSSSGKTTFAKRLAVQLQVIGYQTVILSMDNYFVNRELTPLDKNGDYDFESPFALDIQLFNQNMVDLFAGKEVEIPSFSFATGTRNFNGHKLKMTENSIILVEGIHGLNPMMTEMIPHSQKFKIYVSALTPISIDSSNRIHTTDNRLIRRMIRDFRYRGYSALDTLQRWASVREGEEKHIFPYQEEADVMFNTALIYELGVLKFWAEPILNEVPPVVPEYSEARRLLKFLSYITPISAKEIPPTSILREFLTGSSFNYS